MTKIRLMQIEIDAFLLIQFQTNLAIKILF